MRFVELKHPCIKVYKLRIRPGNDPEIEENSSQKERELWWCTLEQGMFD
jgi:hypothetical protein